MLVDMVGCRGGNPFRVFSSPNSLSCRGSGGVANISAAGAVDREFLYIFYIFYIFLGIFWPIIGLKMLMTSTAPDSQSMSP